MIPPTTVEQDVLIIGAGPAGISTALHLVQRDASWAPRITVVDKAVFPRDKLCGGGITRFGADVLDPLGLDLRAHGVAVTEIGLSYKQLAFVLHGNPAMWVVHRREFDAWLLERARGRGVGVREGETVLDVVPGDERVTVITDCARYAARVVIGADGAGSIVRRRLGLAYKHGLARLLEVLVPDPGAPPAFPRHHARFAFSRMPAGLQGYSWDFPVEVDGKPMTNHGLFHSGIDGGGRHINPHRELADALARGGVAGAEKPRGWPIRLFDTDTTFAQPRVVFVGDAAGVDPLFGEGIAFALAYGDAAAAAVAAAFVRRRFDFVDYKARLLQHPILGQLPLRARMARFVYRSRPAWRITLYWRVASWFVRYLVHRHPEAVPVDDPRLMRARPSVFPG